jgi:L-iditol 2-dehydrogenase
MQINEKAIESIVKEVLSNLNSSSLQSNNDNPSTAKLAYLTGEKKIEVKEVPMPKVLDDEILVKVEGCGVCGTDVHEWKGDPFGLIPVVLGHEGTGEVVALGKNIKNDTNGKPIKVGDKVVSSVLVCGECPMCKFHPQKPNLCDNLGVYGLIPDSADYKLNGWFASHILLRKNSTFFVVNELSLDQRMLLELAAVAVHALERAKTTNIIDFDSKVLVQGCGPVGLMMIAVLKTYGVYNIIALDGDEQRLNMAKKFGALTTLNFKTTGTLEERLNIIKAQNNGMGADFAFQCTGSPMASSDVWKYVRRGGGLAEIGFFVDNGDSKINPHFDICNKEITVVGSWVYGSLEYPKTIAFLKRAKENNVPIEDLITHRYGLYELNEAMETNVALKGIKIAYVNK